MPNKDTISKEEREKSTDSSMLHTAFSKGKSLLIYFL